MQNLLSFVGGIIINCVVKYSIYSEVVADITMDAVDGERVGKSEINKKSMSINSAIVQVTFVLRISRNRKDLL